MGETPPTPAGLPLLGNGLAFARDPVAAMESWATEGDVVRLRIPGESMYLITHPGAIERILVTDQDKFSIGPAQRETFEGVEDQAVTTTTGDRWRRLRRALHPAFTRERIRQYATAVGTATVAAVETWPYGEVVDLGRRNRVLSVAILGDALLGVDLRDRADVLMAAADALIDRANFRRPGQLLPQWVPTPTEWRFRRAVDELDDFVADVLATHQSANSTGETVCGDLLAAEADGDLSREEVRHNLVALLLAGHDSPATALTSAFFLLRDRPQLRQSIAAEFDAEVDGDHPTAADIDALELTRRVVAEALRLYPPTTGVNRQAREPVTLQGYDLEAGAQLLIPQWVVHRDGRFWEDPSAFDPSRWTRDRDRPDYAYFPFSGGPRGCVGAAFARQELVVALATILGHVDVQVVTDGPLSFEPSVQLRPSEPIRARVDPRADVR